MLGSGREIEILKNGGVGVIPTDTVYGIVALFSQKEAVERIYRLKGRDYKKPFVFLIASQADLKHFGISLGKTEKMVLDRLWPGPVSVVLACPSEDYKYLHRGLGSLAFRLSGNEDLTDFISKTGPLASTSVNPQGGEPAKSADEAKKHFGDKIDFYVDGGEIEGRSSTLVKLEKDGLRVLRQGDYKIS